MFNGIVETTGKIIECITHNNSQTISIDFNNKYLSKMKYNEIKIGDSVSINGACLTINKINNNQYWFDISPETLNLTTFRSLKRDDYVNIEFPLTINKLISGHLISGHIDSVGKIKKIDNMDNSWNFLIEVDKSIIKYLTKKGSVAIDGVSLTINEIKKNILSLMIIPHTYENTIIKYYKIGRLVNIETDLIIKYLEKINHGW